MFGLAATACARADTHTALVAEAVVLWQWLATVDDVTSAWTVVVAMCLSVFHALVALMAVTPITAVVAPAILRSWVQRVLIVAAATLAVWVCVLVLDERRAPGKRPPHRRCVRHAHGAGVRRSCAQRCDRSGRHLSSGRSPGYDDVGKCDRA